MSATATLRDERALNELEAAVRPRVAAVRRALGEVIYAPGRQAAADLLTVAPVGECVRIAEAWAAAREAGVTTGRVLNRFDPEEQVLIEMILTVYTAPPPAPTGGTDLHEIALMLDESSPGDPG